MTARRARWSAEDIPDLTGKVAMVTGASSGLGAVTAMELAAHGARVTLAVRSRERGEKVAARIRERTPTADVTVETVDVSDLTSIRSFAHAWLKTHDRLDILVNNAGIMGLPHREETVDGCEKQFGTNHLGAFALTRELMPAIARTPHARVVAVASNAHRPARMDFDDIMSSRAYSPWRAYARSKLANLLFTLELQRRLEGNGIDALAVAAHPGWANTNITTGPLQGRPGLAHRLERIASAMSAIPPEKGALPILYAATAPGVIGNSYWGPSGPGEMRGYPAPAKRSPRSMNEQDAQRLWRLSADLTGGSFLDSESRQP